MGRMYLENISFKSSPTEDQIRRVFMKFDLNNDNRLSKEELRRAFEYLGSIIPSFQAQRALYNADANGDGYVNEEEMDELVKYAVRSGFAEKVAQP